MRSLPPDIHVRTEPADLAVRLATLTPSTADEATRSVEAILCTEEPVLTARLRSGSPVLEAVQLDGMAVPDQLPLLDTHQRDTVAALVGSVRNIARNDSGQLVGRLYLASCEPDTWTKIKEGHLRDVSIGYAPLAATPVRAGRQATISGRSYQAPPDRDLMVLTASAAKECSLTPIGADRQTKIRTAPQAQENFTVSPILRAYLESIGLRHDADEPAAQAFYSALSSAQRASADEHVRTAAGDAGISGTSGHGTNASAGTLPATAAGNGDSARAAVDGDSIRSAAISAERDRVRQITELAGEDVPVAIRTQAVNEGWTLDRASREFLTAVRTNRGQAQTQQTTSADSGPAIHSRNQSAELSIRSLAAGLIVAGGLDPTHCRLYDGRRGRAADQLTEQDADYGDRFSRMSAVDLCRLCVRLDTGRDEFDPDEAVRTAISGGALTYALGTSVYARLLAGWNEVPDSTDWCAEEPDIPNFLQQEDITLNVSSRFERLPKGGTATDATVTDQRETYKLARYAKKFTVDEQDFLSDRLGAVLAVVAEMGNAARRLRPDLVYSTLLANPTLTATGGALFNATAVTTAGGHANLGTGALSTTNFAAAVLAMTQQRKGDVVLNIRPRYLIVPAALMFTGATILNGIALAKTHATKNDPDYVPINPVSNQMLQILQQQQVELRVDDRLGASGVYDPSAKKTRTGSATNWFLSAGGPRTIRVGTRRGTGGLPQMRQYLLSQGQWGVGWDINLDVCVVVADFPGLYQSTGTV